MRSHLQLPIELLRVVLAQLADWDLFAIGIQREVSVAKSDLLLLAEQHVAWLDLRNRLDWVLDWIEQTASVEKLLPQVVEV